jgi:3-phenylpropionate/cinnamic acid dioxygenase small subunit
VTALETSSSLVAEITDLLYREAELLDEHRYEEWLDLLADDYEYRVPQVLPSEADASPRRDTHAYLVMDSKASMRHKLSRRSSQFAWAMRPPAIEHRLVGSVRVVPQGDDLVEARSVVLVTWSRHPEPTALYPARRNDRLRRDPSGGWTFVDRTVHLGTEVPDAIQLAVLY